jgi:two-component system nitrogen regulation sensor histidine kinase GlnL
MPGRSPAGRTPDSDELLQGMTVAIVAVDPNLVVTYLNLAAQNLLGLSERWAVGRSLGDLLEPVAQLARLCERALANSETVSLREFRARIAGREVSLDCKVSALDRDDGLILELTDTTRDRNIRREVELLEQQRTSRRIVRQLAHEVKNPLGGMRGAAQLLERKLPTRELRRYTSIIIDEADRLAKLVDKTLRSGGLRQVENINVHELTEHVAELIRAEAPDGVKIVRDYDVSLPRVAVDRNQIIQALLNIAKNAVQSLGDEGQIVLRTRAVPNFTIGRTQHRFVISIEIEDNGPGIPEDLQENVFYPLVTSKPSGTGVGLTIAQDLVGANGGLIEFDSRPGRTLFQVRIPIGGGDAGEGPAR